MSRHSSTPATGPQAVQRVEALVAPMLEQDGYELVLVELVAAPSRPSLRISIDRSDRPGQVTLDDCVRVNRLLEDSAELDALIPGAYNLEISSPGVNRPLVRERDYTRFIGEKAQVTTREPIEGRRKFTGRLHRVDGGELGLDLGGGVIVSIPLSQILKANLKPDTADLFRRQIKAVPVAELEIEAGDGELSDEASTTLGQP